MRRIAGLVRVAALSACLPACDQVFGLDGYTLDTPCGMFGAPRPVAIDPRLSDPVRFSFVTAESVGIVSAVLDKDPSSSATKRSDYAVKWNGAMWMYDEARSNGLKALADGNSKLRHAVSTRDEKRLFGSLNTNFDGVYHLYGLVQTGAGWVSDVKEVSQSNSSTSYAGLELVDNPGQIGAEQSSVPIFRTSLGDLSKVVAVAVKNPGETEWIDDKDGGTLSTKAINDTHWATGGALVRVNRQQVLIYAARPEQSAVGSDLFFSVRESGSFQAPQKLSSFDSSDDEVEPWVDEACTTITFRRTDPNNRHDDDPDGDTLSGGTIYQAEIEDPGEP